MVVESAISISSQTHTKAGKVIWLNVSSLAVPSRKKDRFLFAHLYRDITKRMRILGLAGENKSFFRSLLGMKPGSRN